jgi:hypothetical protein
MYHLVYHYDSHCHHSKNRKKQFNVIHGGPSGALSRVEHQEVALDAF